MTQQEKVKNRIQKQNDSIYNLRNVLREDGFEIDDAMFGFTATRRDIKVRVWIKKLNIKEVRGK